ncbi:N-substituted formamide deformylase [Paraburkholderia caffeinitolerans]|uniref:N-substituted formamide deformylase n=1 Tax=Paraburkholderia caffeinitolerans TaxID=1723730 RepID=A0A6J5GNG8_9BURK|nr:amidohydrolase [Paraburkholderia caffeinitolerans]CAB3802705.1 N-substituted formamide deformylase [Paraburkholderia caffeinitolerans]
MSTQETGNTAADVLFTNAKVYTVDPHKPWAQAVAVRRERIVFVGDERAAQAWVGENTRVIDAAGRLMLPGFVESHWHFETTASAFQAFVNYEDPQAVIGALREYVDTHPEEKAITGMGWIQATIPPEMLCKETLDAVCPDRPVCLLSTDFHTAWANSKALEIAGIDASTPPVQPGASWFEKDPVTGEPTGVIVDGAAYSLLLKRISDAGYLPKGMDLYLRSFAVWQDKLAAAGITTVFDAGFMDPSGDQSLLYETLQDMERRDDLKLRVVGSVAVVGEVEKPVEMLREFNQRYDSPLVKARALKLFLDGTEANHTAWLLEPYADRADTCGAPTMPVSEFEQHLLEADKAGFNVMVHCVGDAAVRAALDGFERVNHTNPQRDRRHVITHAFLTHPSDIPRFRELGVMANTQLQWGVVDLYTELLREHYGTERWSNMYKFRTFIEQGVTVSTGMDGLACQCRCQHRPVEHIESGHTRQLAGEPDAPALPDINERLSIPQLIAAYTINGAWQLGLEHEVGSVTVGKRADLIVLENNLFEVNKYQIGKIDIALTMMNGGVTHAAGSMRAAFGLEAAV